MLEGLVGWLGGEMTALLIWLGLGVTAAGAVWVLMIVWRGGDLPLRTTRYPDGHRQTGALVWLGLFVVLLCWLPLGILAVHVAGYVWEHLVFAAYGVVDSAAWIGHLWPLWAVLAFAYAGWRVTRTTRVRSWWRARHEAAAAGVQAPAAVPHDPMPHTPPPQAVEHPTWPVPVPPGITPGADHVPPGDEFYARPPAGSTH